MISSFKDHFSTQADVYARYRPVYPGRLFAYLASLVSTRDLAWDCGTGNGQAALGLAAHFRHVIASDPSAKQIQHATRHPNVEYVVGAAEEPPARAMGASLVTVAQALHWFDFDRFYPALAQVLRPDGVFAAWGYGHLHITPAIDAVVRRYYTEIVGPYWPPDRRHIEAGYRTLPFPLHEMATLGFSLEARWDLDTVLGYLATWSATQGFIQDQGVNPLDQIRVPLGRAWGDATIRDVIWPVFMRVGRLPLLS